MRDFAPILALISAVALVQVALLVYRWRQAAEGARLEWARRVAEGERPAGVDEAKFARIFQRVHGPRAQVYILLALGGAIAVTPLAFSLLGLGWRLVWIATGKPESYADGTLIWQFFLFFGVIACWAGVAALFARRYHAKRPGDLDQELARARAG